MILVGNQRGGGKDLAVHLMKPENDHVDIHELRGFASETLHGAFQEAFAISRATKCRKFLFSLSVNPPADKVVPTSDFIDAINRAERELGLTGQPRAIVFHEKNGRRHAHCVWSRIDVDACKAVHMPFTKKTLVGLTRDIFIERGWDIPDGLIDKNKRDPLQYTLAEYQQSKRVGRKPQDIKRDFQSAWASSDSLPAFKHALRERGYWLACGDRNGFVALDHNFKPFALARQLGIRTKQVKEKLGEPTKLPAVDKVTNTIKTQMGKKLEGFQNDVSARAKIAQTRFEKRRNALVKKQRAERQALARRQQQEWIAATKERQARFSRGLSGLWDRLRGEHRRIRKLNEQEALTQFKAQQQRKDTLIQNHLKRRIVIELLRSNQIKYTQKMEEFIGVQNRHYSVSPEF